eukprot:CAMPEP_0117436636 /NCGR_PEP_ID=MMETSP0759-20121206/1109_1 /TAXON_ID=63605 /ORGANISM="Percolomonas cosmopolitus, Strain WS" /LENGTH=460 /DNA_ID=CAMNT_0005228241 /DNA_START=74 /DNA_END=1453 /DNA_ORIENTATION=+
MVSETWTARGAENSAPLDNIFLQLNRVHPVDARQGSPERRRLAPDALREEDLLCLADDDSTLDLLPKPQRSANEPQFIRARPFRNGSLGSLSHADDEPIVLDSVFMSHSHLPHLKRPTSMRVTPPHADHSIIASPSPHTQSRRQIPQIATTDSVQISSHFFYGSMISIKIITFNMNGRSFQNQVKEKLSWMQPNSKHMYVFASQECETSIEWSFFSQAKKEWANVLDGLFGENYAQIASVTMLGLHLVVFVQMPMVERISDVRAVKVSTTLFGNKGSVGISCCFDKKRLLFINAHLAAHQNNVKQRVKSYHTIIRDLAAELVPLDLNVEQQDYSSVDALSSHYDYMFFCGDLNFRIDASRREVDRLLKKFPQSLPTLLSKDQLNQAKQRGEAFDLFEEEPITFRPTFKFDPFSNDYDTSKKRRIPSWTDRIMFFCNKTNERDNQIVVQEYSSCTTCEYVG